MDTREILKIKLKQEGEFWWEYYNEVAYCEMNFREFIEHVKTRAVVYLYMDGGIRWAIPVINCNGKDIDTYIFTHHFRQ